MVKSTKIIHTEYKEKEIRKKKVVKAETSHEPKDENLPEYTHKNYENEEGDKEDIISNNKSFNKK